MPNSKTLVQTILAAFCAILCTHLCVGGGGMNISARTGCWAKSGYTAKDYVQDGLIAMWDGIENAGWGVHDPNATVWKDLIGSRNATLTSSGSWTDTSLHGDGSNYSANDGAPIPYASIRAIEIVYSVDGTGIISTVGSNYKGVNRSIIIDKQSSTQMRTMIVNSASAGLHNSISVGSGKQAVSLNYSETDCISATVNNVVKSIGYIFFGIAASTIAFHGRSSGTSNASVGDLYALRVYNRNLTAAEKAANYAIDKARFGLT